MPSASATRGGAAGAGGERLHGLFEAKEADEAARALHRGQERAARLDRAGAVARLERTQHRIVETPSEKPARFHGQLPRLGSLTLADGNTALVESP